MQSLLLVPLPQPLHGVACVRCNDACWTSQSASREEAVCCILVVGTFGFRSVMSNECFHLLRNAPDGVMDQTVDYLMVSYVKNEWIQQSRSCSDIF
jgi:hypothetical protein